MSQSNLAYLDDALEREIAIQMETSRALDTGERARIAGISVIKGEPAVGDEIAERRSALQHFVNDRDALKAKLDAAGVTYLAIWPSEKFEELWRAKGLYTMRPSPEGTVRVSTDLLEGLEETAKAKLGNQAWYALIAGGALGAVVVSLLTATIGLLWFEVIITALVGACVGGVLIGKLVERRNFRQELPIPAKLAKMEFRLLREFFDGPRQTVLG